MSRLKWILLVGLLLIITTYFFAPSPRVVVPLRTTKSNELDDHLDLEPRRMNRTIVVPTLETPITDGKNVIWTASLQTAWDAFTNEIGERVQFNRQQPWVDQLNHSEFDHEAISPNDLTTEIERSPLGLVITSTIRLRIPWTHEFFNHSDGLKFQTNEKRSKVVSAFGIRSLEEYNDGEFRKQVLILWESLEANGEFALDLCKHTTPYQVVLIKMPKQKSLADSLAYHRAKVEERSGKSPESLHLEDVLAIPNMRWRLLHEFIEFQGLTLLNKNHAGQKVRAMTDVQLRLDRSGASASSSSKIIIANGGPRELYFNRAFLILISHRASQTPLFVAWIVNDELLLPLP